MIFTVRNGCFGYKTKDVLKDISFTVGDGEVLSVLGSNGVGKNHSAEMHDGTFEMEKRKFLRGWLHRSVK